MGDYENLEEEKDKLKQVKAIILTLTEIIASLKDLSQLTGRERIIEEHSINSYNQPQLINNCISSATKILDNIISTSHNNDHINDAEVMKIEVTSLKEEFATIIVQNGFTNRTHDLSGNTILNISEEA